MAPIEPTLAGHVALLVLSGGICLGLAAWVHAGDSDAAGGRWFGALLVADGVWALSAAAGLLASPDWKGSLLLVRTVAQLTVPLLWLRFTSAHTGRRFSLTRPLEATLATGYALSLVAVLTNGLHGLYWSSTTVRTDPFAYLAISPGPAQLVTYAYIFVATGFGIHQLAALFTRSRHRSSFAVYVLLLGALLGSLPSLLTVFGVGPLPGYDYSVFGIGVFAGLTAVSVYVLGGLDVEPVARDVLFDVLDDAVLVFDGEGRLADFNVAAEQLWPALGSSGASRLGESLSAVAPALAASLPPLDRIGSSRTEELSLTVDGTQRHFSVRVAPVSDVTQVGHTLVVRDVTELAEHRRELERQNAQLDEFASAVAHDLRNPLNVADGYAELAADAVGGTGREATTSTGAEAETGAAADGPTDADADGDGDERSPPAAGRAAEHLDRVQGAHDRMLGIIDDLQTLARKGQSVESTEPLDLRTVAEDAWTHLDTERATLRVREDAVVRADRSRLLSILENLYRNSVRHAGDDTVIEIDAADGAFHVQDDGPGVPEADRETVFEYGYTTHDEGTGLGLPIVRTMAESHGWSVRLDASYDDGARLVFEDVNVEPAEGSDGGDDRAANGREGSTAGGGTEGADGPDVGEGDDAGDTADAARSPEAAE